MPHITKWTFPYLEDILCPGQFATKSTIINCIYFLHFIWIFFFCLHRGRISDNLYFTAFYLYIYACDKWISWIVIVFFFFVVFFFAFGFTLQGTSHLATIVKSKKLVNGLKSLAWYLDKPFEVGYCMLHMRLCVAISSTGWQFTIPTEIWFSEYFKHVRPDSCHFKISWISLYTLRSPPQYAIVQFVVLICGAQWNHRA